MRKHAALSFIALLLISCGRAPGGFETPEAAALAYLTAYEAHDVDKVVATFVKSERSQAREDYEMFRGKPPSGEKFELGKVTIEGDKASIPVTYQPKDSSQSPYTVTLHLRKEDGWRITEAEEKAKARAAEAHSALARLKDRLKLKFLNNNNSLPDGLKLNDLARPEWLWGSYYGTYSLSVAGSASDGYSGTTLTAKPKDGVNAPTVTLTIRSLVTGKSDFDPPAAAPSPETQVRIALDIIRDRLRTKCIQNNNDLPDDLRLSDVVDVAELQSESYGDFTLAITHKDERPIATVVAKPLAGKSGPTLRMTVMEILDGVAVYDEMK